MIYRLQEEYDDNSLMPALAGSQALTMLAAGWPLASSSWDMGPVWLCSTTTTHVFREKNLQCMEY